MAGNAATCRDINDIQSRHSSQRLCSHDYSTRSLVDEQDLLSLLCHKALRGKIRSVTDWQTAAGQLTLTNARCDDGIARRKILVDELQDAESRSRLPRSS